MKKFLQFFMVVTIASFTFVSCSNDDDDDLNLNLDPNTAEYNGKEYKIYDGGQELYLSENNIDVFLYLDDNENDCIWLEMGIPSGNKTLPAGTYSFHKWTEEEKDKYDEEKEFTFAPWIFTSKSSIIINGNERNLTDGTVKVAVNGSTYEIQLSCSVEGNKSVIAYYKGKLDIID